MKTKVSLSYDAAYQRAIHKLSLMAAFVKRLEKYAQETNRHGARIYARERRQSYITAENIVAFVLGIESAEMSAAVTSHLLKKERM